MAKSRARLEAERQKYLLLKQVTLCKGWPLVQEVLMDAYNEALETIQTAKTIDETLEAKGTIKFIKKFTDTLNSEMGFGKLAQAEYVKKHVNPLKGQEPE